MYSKAGLPILKKLLQINKNRINIYKIAYKDTHYKDLKAKFMQYSATSKKNKAQLLKIMKGLKSKLFTITSLKASLFILNMRFNMLISNYGRKTILDFCYQWEDTVKKGYRAALHTKNTGKISLANQQIMLNQQKQMALEQADISSMRKTSV